MTDLQQAGPVSERTSFRVAGRQPRLRRRRRFSALPGRISLLLGGGIVATYVLAGIFAPLVARRGPNQQNLNAILAGPSGRHWLGTDQLGRDVWARLVYSVRIDVPISVLAVGVAFVLGTALGMLVGYSGGIVGAVIMRIGDVVLAFPFTVLVIALVFALGSGATSVFIAFAATGWISYTVIARGETITESKLEYVLAARTLGYGRTRILLRHVLPNIVTQGLLYAMSDIVMTVSAIVGLGYLGLGVRPPTPEWGSMIADGTPFITTHWLVATSPGIAVVVFGIGLSMLGDGLAGVMKVGR